MSKRIQTRSRVSTPLRNIDAGLSAQLVMQSKRDARLFKQATVTATKLRREEPRLPAGRYTLAELCKPFWDTERVEAELTPVALFSGNLSLGRIQGAWNYAKVLQELDLVDLPDAKRLGVERPDLLHATGLHISAEYADRKIRNCLFTLASRVTSVPHVIDEGMTTFLRDLAGRAGWQLYRLQPIERWSVRARRDYRKCAGLEKLGATPLPSSWPFIAKVDPVASEGLDLVQAVDAVVPRFIPQQVREDVCQDLVLAVLQGDVSVERLAERYSEYVGRVFQQFRSKYGPLSLDAPPPWAQPHDARPLGELLTA